jgi:hypothetical protein
MRKEWNLFRPLKDEPSDETDDIYCCDCERRLAYTVKGKRIYTKNWFTCAYCGKPVCDECRKAHIPRCIALTWGKAHIDEETGELVLSDEKPDQFTM